MSGEEGQSCENAWSKPASQLERATVDVKIILASGVVWGSLSAILDWRTAGSNTRSIVGQHWILCDCDDVDARKVWFGGWVDVSSDAKRDFTRS
jgi:ribosome modulation factor